MIDDVNEIVEKFERRYIEKVNEVQAMLIEETGNHLFIKKNTIELLINYFNDYIDLLDRFNDSKNSKVDNESKTESQEKFGDDFPRDEVKDLEGVGEDGNAISKGFNLHFRGPVTKTFEHLEEDKRGEFLYKLKGILNDSDIKGIRKGNSVRTLVREYNLDKIGEKPSSELIELYKDKIIEYETKIGKTKVKGSNDI